MSSTPEGPGRAHLLFGLALAAGLNVGAGAGPAGVTFHQSEIDFLQAVADAAKVEKFAWSFKPDTLPPGGVVALDDPLDITTHALNPDDPWGDLWPLEVDNVQFTSNTDPQGPLAPRGLFGLAYAKPGVVPELTNNALIANVDLDSFDVVSGPPAGGSHTALAFELVSLDLDGVPKAALFRVTVYDELDTVLGTIDLGATQGEKIFLGIESDESTIGRVDIWDVVGGHEGISLIAAYAGTGCPGAGGDCCAAHPTPGCADVGCCQSVCALDPFCCDFQWDQVCAEEAAASCPATCPAPLCPSDDEESCCVAHPTPGCEDMDCCQAVCAQDPACCLSAWDEICAILAMNSCPLPGPKQDQQVLADLNAAIAGTNMSIAELNVAAAGAADGLVHIQDALDHINNAFNLYAQATHLSQQCGSCAVPAQTFFNNIADNLAGADQQGIDGQQQMQDVDLQIAQALDQALAAIPQLTDALQQMLDEPPDRARAKDKVKRAKEQQKRAEEKKKRALDKIKRQNEKAKRQKQKLDRVKQQNGKCSLQLQQCGSCAQPALDVMVIALQEVLLAEAAVDASIQAINGACADPGGSCGALRASITSGQASIDLLVESIGLLSGCQSQPACPWDCAGNDGVVSVLDFLGVLSQWGQTGTPCDFGGDGVGVNDFLDVLAHWGPCPVCPLPPPPADLCLPLQHLHCSDDLPFDELCVPLIAENGPDGAPHAVLCHCVNQAGSGLCWIDMVAPRVISCSGTCPPPLVCRLQIVTPGGDVIIDQNSQHFTNGDAVGSVYICFCGL